MWCPAPRTSPPRCERWAPISSCCRSSFRSGSRRGLAAELRDLYPHRAGIAEDSRFYGTGLLILSRHPVEDAACTAFAQQTLEEGLFGPRGMVACTVRAPGFGRLRVINLHATAGGAYRQHRRKGAPDRRSAQLAEAIEAAAAPFDGTVVLGGDFNCSPVTAPRVGTRLQEAGFVDAAAGLSRGTWDPDNPLNRDRARGPAHRVDHVFVRPGSGRQVTVADARIVLDEPLVRLAGGGSLPLSDHYGLLAALAPA